jgi:hypothetical protein
MSDLYSLIRQSIIDRGLISAAAREEVYQQARTAVIRELWSYEPPLAEEDINARVTQFDRAIDQLEGDLAEAFAEPAEAPPGPPSQPAKGAVSVFEGYDRDSDYVPGYVAQPPRPSQQRPDSARAQGSRAELVTLGGAAGGLDPLALRSAAIEAALRSGGDDLFFEEERQSERHPEDMDLGEPDAFAEPSPTDDDHPPTSRAWADDAPSAAAGEAWEDQDDDGSDLPSSQHYEGNEAPEAAARRPRVAQLANLSERTRIGILVGAIAALGLVLVVLAGIMLSSLIAPSGGSRETAALRRAPAPSRGGETAASAADVVQTFSVFDGGDPSVFDSGPDNPVRFDKSTGFARITSSAADPGVRVIIGPGLAGRFAGRSVRVTLVARAARENGATGLRFAYENGIAISHWQAAHLGNDFVPYNLVWPVPAMRADPNTDQLLIEPGIPGDGTAADIRSIKIDVLK